MLKVKFNGGPLDGKLRSVQGYDDNGIRKLCQSFQHGELNLDANGRIKPVHTFIHHNYLLQEKQTIRKGQTEITYEYQYEEGR